MIHFLQHESRVLTLHVLVRPRHQTWKGIKHFDVCGNSDVHQVSLLTSDVMHVLHQLHLVCSSYKETRPCHPGVLVVFFPFLYHPEFKGTHADSVGEAQCGSHGDRYSRVTTAAGRRRGRIFPIPFYMCSNQGDLDKTDRMRWISGYMPAVFFSFSLSNSFTLTPSLSPYLTPCHPVF